MPKTFLSLLQFWLLLTATLNIKAQVGMNVASSSIRFDGMTHDYSIGEMMLVSTERASNLIVTQGILQPNGGSTSISSSNAALSNLDNPIKVYPNPTSHLIFVEMYETSIQEYSCNLYDATGKIVMSQKGQTQIGQNKLELNMENLASGSYFLMMQKNDVNEQTQRYSYKIQKVD